MSVDLAAGIYGGLLHQATLVSDHKDKMRFARATENGVARYDVLDWAASAADRCISSRSCAPSSGETRGETTALFMPVGIMSTTGIL